MNLGESNLKYVNTSRPQLVHTNSKQSVTASDDYYSLNSDISSDDDQNTFQRYETPPMLARPANASQDVLMAQAKESEATIAPLRPIKHRDPPDEIPAVAMTSEEHKIRRKPLSSSSSQGTIVRRPIEEVSPTPGVDDTPYIQFAIDQLTRDEEVAGPRQPTVGSDASYPVDRIIPDERVSNEYRPMPLRQHPTNPRPLDPPPAESVLLPLEPPRHTFTTPKLNFVPTPLHFLSLITLFLCCLLMMAALLYLALWPQRHHGLWQYDGVGTSRYFVFQYLPTILASLIIIWVLIIQGAIGRIFPFVVLSSRRDTPNSNVLHDTALFPTNYVMPSLTFFKRREPLLGVCSLTFWLTLFTVPLQSCLFQTRYYTAEKMWRWTAVQPVAWTLFVLYLMLALALPLLFWRFAFTQTGLKWDPVCLADILTLFHHANFLSDFEQTEINGYPIGNPTAKRLRLGYWYTWTHPDRVFYGVGEEYVPKRRQSLEQGRIVPVTDLSAVDLEGQRYIKSEGFNTLQREIYIPSIRYRWLPWFLKDAFTIVWVVIAISLTIAFVVVSFVNNAVKTGFLPLLPAPTKADGFSAADFLYSFLPSLIGMILFLLWQPIDIYSRALEPFVNLSKPDGALAEQSLLLDYTSRLPVEVTCKALQYGHFKVAWISFISLLSITLPILAGGVFTAQFIVKTQDVRIAADLSGYYALVVFVIIYALSFAVLFRGRFFPAGGKVKQGLPHDIRTLGQLLSFVYQSPILTDAIFRDPSTKIDLQTRLIGTSSGERMMRKYAFGVFLGRDRVEHLGIDRMEGFGSPGIPLRTK